MPFKQFLRVGSGRVLRVTFGAALVGIGIAQGSMTGLLLTMIGLVPVITGVANVYLFDDVASDVVARMYRRTRF